MSSDLERRARRVLVERGPKPQDVETTTEHLVHELQTHQVELELQNDELLKSQEHLSDALARYQALYDFAPVGYVTIDHQGRVRQCNLTFSTMLGYQRESLTKKPLITCISSAYHQLFFDFLRSVFYSKDRQSVEIELSKSSDHSRRWVRLDGTVSKGIGDELLCSCAVTDLTERKEIESRMHHNEKMAVLGQLAGGIAHDFNNQLAAMLGYAELLCEAVPRESRLFSYAEGIAEGAKRARTLTRHLLAYSRKAKYQVAVIDVRTLLADVLMLAERVMPVNLQVICAPVNTPLLVEGDSALLQNAVLNLILNARDAMPEGGQIHIEATLTEWDQIPQSRRLRDLTEGRYARVTVIDRGIGMDDEVLSHLFEPYFTTKGIGSGTGLGLAAVYGTIKHHGGAVDVNTVLGQGSAFSIYLPLTTKPLPVPGSVSITPLPQAPFVLIVDDDAPVLTTTTQMMQRLGCETESCTSGEQAIELAQTRNGKIDLVVLDLLTPGMGGSETFRRLRSIRPDLPILLATGYYLDEQTQQLLDAGNTALIRKPFTLEEVMRSASALLRLKMRT